MKSLAFLDSDKVVIGCAPGVLATTVGDGDYVSLKNFDRVAFVLSVDNATTVTGGVVTLKQATLVDGTGEKALAFTKMWANEDTAASDTLVETAVTSNTFTTDTTDAKNLLYIIEIQAADLDVSNSFDCVRIDVASSANSVGSCVYLLRSSRYAPALAVSSITD